MRRKTLALVALIVSTVLLWTWDIGRRNARAPQADASAAVVDDTRPNSSFDGDLAAEPWSFASERTEIESDSIAILPPTPRELRARALQIEIEVVDAEDRPVRGAQLHLATDDPIDGLVGWRGTSDSNGRARVSRAFSRDRLRREELVLAPTLARSSPQEVRFTLSAPPTNPVRFRLAPTGTVELVALHGDGRPFQSEVEWTLAVEPRADAKLPDPRVRVLTRLRAPKGTLLVEHVGLGFHLAAFARSPSHEFRWTTFDGPSRTGERTRVELRVDRVRGRCRGSVVDADRRPLSHVDVTAQFSFLRENGERFVGSTWFRATTDANGAFDVDELSKKHSEVVELRAFRAGRELGRAFGPVPIESDGSRAAGRPVFDFGEVSVLEERMFATGRVVDTNDQPVAGVAIQVRNAGEHEWRFANLSSDSHGRFAIPASVCRAPAEVRARRSDSCVGPAVRVGVDASDVELTVGECGSIEGELRLPAGMSPSELEFRAGIRGGTAFDFDHFVETTYDERGFFELEKLAPGEWNVFVEHEGRTLFERKSVLVRANAVTSLGVIDLRERVFVLQLGVQSASGAPLAEVSAILFDDQGREASRAVFGRDGKARFESPTPERAVLIHSSSHQNVFVPRAVDGMQITLMPRGEQLLEWPADIVLLPEDHSARVVLDYVGPELLTGFGTRIECSSRFDLPEVVRPAFAGRYRISIEVDGADGAAKHELALPGTSVYFAETSPTLPAVLPVDPESIERFLRELR